MRKVLHMPCHIQDNSVLLMLSFYLCVDAEEGTLLGSFSGQTLSPSEPSCQLQIGFMRNCCSFSHFGWTLKRKVFPQRVTQNVYMILPLSTPWPSYGQVKIGEINVSLCSFCCFLFLLKILHLTSQIPLFLAQ